MRQFEDWLGTLSKIDWVVRLRSVWDRNGPEDLEAAKRTVAYLARYANRVAISNSRLIAIEGHQVLFSYKDYRDRGQWKTAEVHGVEFIGRFLRHVLPPRLRLPVRPWAPLAPTWSGISETGGRCNRSMKAWPQSAARKKGAKD